MVGVVDRAVLDGAVRRWSVSQHREQFMLRGSYVTGIWIGVARRGCDDLDFLALFSSDEGGTKDGGLEVASCAFRKLLSIDIGDQMEFDTKAATTDPIFAETDFPGVRLVVPVSRLGSPLAPLQIDIAFNDPLPICGLVKMPLAFATGHPISVSLPTPELAFGWKLHGLVEREGFVWRPKDLADLWLIQRHVQLDRELLIEAIRIAFESRDGPFWRLDRLVNRELGKTSGSKRKWTKYQLANSGAQIPDLDVVVDDLATLLSETVAQLRSKHGNKGPHRWNRPLKLEDFRELARTNSSFREYRWSADQENEDGFVFVCERATKAAFPPLRAAATSEEHYWRLVKRECRGITFDADGRLLAWPYSQFERVEDLREKEFHEGVILEKLDGSLVFPTRTSGKNWKWRTRRGVSDIARAAGEFATQSKGDYEGLVNACFEQDFTPIFEWCSRSRWIVFDHPVDRLVLTGVRDNFGLLMSYEELVELANRFGVEVISTINCCSDLDEFVTDVRSWIDREGCVIRLPDGRQFKVKSDRYLWLHRAVEGPNRNRAWWYLHASGATDQLLECSRGRGMELEEFLARIDFAITAYAGRILKRVESFKPASVENRKRLAESLQLDRVSNLESRLVFQAFDGSDLEAVIRDVIQQRCETESSFVRLVEQLDGPVLEN